MELNNTYINFEIKVGYVPETGEDYLSLYITANEYYETDYKLENPKEVGYALCYIVNPRTTNGINPFILDGISFDFINLYYFLEKKYPKKLKAMETTNTAYIVELEVYKDYRNQGIASKILETLTTYLKYTRIKDLYLCSFPMDEDLEEDDPRLEEFKDKLDNLYLKNGFNHIGVYNDFKYMQKSI